MQSTPTKRRPSRVFSETEWKEADELGKIYISLIEPGKWPLPPSLVTKLEHLREVWAIMLSEPTQLMRIRKIAETIEMSERTVKRYMEDAIFLFGDIFSVDDAFEKAFIYDKLKTLAHFAEQDGDYATAGKLWGQAIKLKSYDNPDGSLKKGDLQLPTVIFTNDAAILNDSNPEIEDADFEEENLLER